MFLLNISSNTCRAGFCVYIFKIIGDTKLDFVAFLLQFFILCNMMLINLQLCQCKPQFFKNNFQLNWIASGSSSARSMSAQGKSKEGTFSSKGIKVGPLPLLEHAEYHAWKRHRCVLWWCEISSMSSKNSRDKKIHTSD